MASSDTRVTEPVKDTEQNTAEEKADDRFSQDVGAEAKQESTEEKAEVVEFIEDVGFVLTKQNIDIFEAYVIDYLNKSSLLKTAETLVRESTLEHKIKSVIDVSPPGFLYKWWSVLFGEYAKHTGSIATCDAVAKASALFEFLNEICPDEGPILEDHSLLDIFNKTFPLKETLRFCSKNVMEFTCLEMSHSGSYLALGTSIGKVLFWDLLTFEVSTLALPSGSAPASARVSDVGFNSNSMIFGTCYFDLVLYLRTTGVPDQVYRKCSCRTESIKSLSFHPETRKNKEVVCCTDGQNIVSWNILGGRTTLDTPDFRLGKDIQKIRFQPVSGGLLAVVEKTSLYLMESDTQEKLTKKFILMDGECEIKDFCWHSNGKLIAAVTDREARVWSSVAWSCVKQLQLDGVRLNACVFYPNTATYLVIAAEKKMCAWDYMRERTRYMEAPDQDFKLLAASSNHHSLASLDASGCLQMWGCGSLEFFELASSSDQTNDPNV